MWWVVWGEVWVNEGEVGGVAHLGSYIACSEGWEGGREVDVILCLSDICYGLSHGGSASYKWKAEHIFVKKKPEHNID